MPDSRPGPRGRARFRTTHWSLVVAAGRGKSPDSRAALSELCETYWYPLYAFARRSGSSPEEAQDLTQGFFADLLQRETLRHADPERGRFRSFLLTAFRNYARDEHDRRTALKRGGGATLLPIDGGQAESMYAREPSHEETPERLYARRWALTVLGRALDGLREEYGEPGRREVFEAVRGALVPGSAHEPYAKTARRLGMTEVAVKVAVHRLRRRFRDRLKEEIAKTIADGADVRGEIANLMEALADPAR